MGYQNSMGTQANIIKRLLSIDEAAIYLGRTSGAIRELVFKGKVPAVKIDRRVQIDRQDLDRLIEKSKVTEVD